MYNVFKIPKGNGKLRIIEEPDPVLKEQQHRILESLSPDDVSEYAHAFVAGRSIKTMAEPHIGKEFVACCDIVDFFPSITADKLAYRVPLSIPFLFTVTHNFGDGKGPRLPQGTPTSPMLSNMYLYDFDQVISLEAERCRCIYTRYADDLVFSGDSREKMKILLERSKSLLENTYQLKINNKKTKIMHRSQRQNVCGVVVNEKLNVPRVYRKNLRAEVFSQRGRKKLNRKTIGKKAFVKMVRGEA